MRIVFMGSADFGLNTLEALQESPHRVVGVVTTPPRCKGRGRLLKSSPVGEYCEENSIEPVLIPENLEDPGFIKELSSFEADIFVVAAYRILPSCVFNIPEKGTFNLHASLLPAYRGPAPIHRAIQAGESETGITIFRIDSGIDTGDIVSKRKTEIGPFETTPEVYTRLSILGALEVVRVCSMIEQGKVEYSNQEDSGASRAPKLRKEEGLINWESTAEEIFNKIRAFKPFPGTWSFLRGKRICIDWAVPSDAQGSPGEVLSTEKKGVIVGCREGSLELLRVKPEGKRCMEAADFLNGFQIKPGERFE
ncbi:MAG: methionyl-tRNA formyltransferase [Chitinivibrionales bacterium]